MTVPIRIDSLFTGCQLVILSGRYYLAEMDKRFGHVSYVNILEIDRIE